jgi:hypothetical protein
MAEPQIYDVTGAVVNRDEAIIGLFDLRYNTVMIVRPIYNKEDNRAELSIEEPDGAERLYWLEKFGMITEEEFRGEAKKLSSAKERRRLYELLGKEFGVAEEG